MDFIDVCLPSHLHADYALKALVSMLPMSFPFTAGYEATFENASVSFYEKVLNGYVETGCRIYTYDKKETVTLKREEQCKALLTAAINDFCHDKNSGLSIENALPGLSIAFELSGSTGK